MKEQGTKAGDEALKTKLTNLWSDHRKYRERLILSAVVIFSVCFTFLFFGPIEITAYSQSSLLFTLDEALPIMAAFMLVAFLLGSLLVSLFRGKVFDTLVTAVFSLLICGYIQGNFLNGKLGALTGDPVRWQEQTSKMAVNLLIWILIFVIAFFILYMNKDVWKKMLLFVSAALIVMQSVAAVSIFTNKTFKTTANSANYLSTAGMNTYAPKHNILVFLLDRMDYDYIDQILQDKPYFFSKLDGFTSYTNAISEHARTKPAINYMFTNCDQLLWKVPANQYFEQSWDYNHHNILKDLKSANYTIDFYTEIDCMFGSGNTVKDYVSNLSCNRQIDKTNLVKGLTLLSAYRYLPTALKPFFWCYTDDINNGVCKNNPEYKIDETIYDNVGPFVIDNKKNNFKFIHFMGSHPPYKVNENGFMNGPTNVVRQTEGDFNILYRAFDKMKKLGIYKDATIIISADHGEPVADDKPLQKANRIGFFYKPAGSADKPLQYSTAPISFKNFPATIAEAAGVDFQKYGKPIDQVGQNDQVVRHFYKSVVRGSTEKQVYLYDIYGNAADFVHWKQTGVEPALYSFW